MLDDESAKIAAWRTYESLSICGFSHKYYFPETYWTIGIPGICNFLDDFIVTGQNREERLSSLSQVFQRCMDGYLKIKLGKRALFWKKVCISKKGIKKSGHKVKLFWRRSKIFCWNCKRLLQVFFTKLATLINLFINFWKKL